MPTQPVGVNADGIYPYDSQVVTVNGHAFILEEITFTEGSKFNVSNNEFGVPRGGRDTREVITASCTAQYPSGGDVTQTPALFAVIPLIYRGNSSAKNFILTEVGIPQKAGMETKSAWKLREQLNAGT